MASQGAPEHSAATTSESTEERATPVSIASQLLVFVSLSLAVLLSAMDVTMVSILMPTLADEFSSVDQVGWYGSV